MACQGGHSGLKQVFTLLAITVACLFLIETAYSQTVPATPSPTCHNGYEYDSGYCYRLLYYYYQRNREGWRRECLHQNAQLLTISSAAEQTYIMSYLTRHLQSSYPGVYIGLIATNGHQRWEDKRLLDYTNWAQGQPSFSNGESCAYIYYYNNVHRGQWFMRPCSNNLHYAVCKSSAACYTGWYYKLRRCYIYIGATHNWQTADNACKYTYGGNLVSINDDAEQQALDYWLWVKAGVGVSKWLWIGLNDRAEEGHLEWTDSSPLTYTKWAASQPVKDDRSDCAQMYKNGPNTQNGHGQWQLQACDGFSLSYVCERPAATAHLPTEDIESFTLVGSPPITADQSDIRCFSSSMSYALLKSIAPQDKYEVPHLKSDVCLPIDNGTHYVFDVVYKECETEIQSVNGKLVYYNKIFARALHTLPDYNDSDADPVANSLIQPTVEIDLKCSFNKDLTVSTYNSAIGFIVHLGANTVFNVAGLGTFRPAVALFDSNSYSNTIPVDEVVVYGVSQRAYFQFSVTTDDRLSLRAIKCWVNVGRYFDVPQEVILQNGCPSSNPLHGTQVESDPGRNVYGVSYTVFGFASAYQGRLQYLHCTLRVCNATDPRAFCNQRCEQGRRRRQASDQPTEVVEVANGRNFTYSTSSQGFFVTRVGSTSGSPSIDNMVSVIAVACLMAMVFDARQFYF